MGGGIGGGEPQEKILPRAPSLEFRSKGAAVTTGPTATSSTRTGPSSGGAVREHGRYLQASRSPMFLCSLASPAPRLKVKETVSIFPCPRRASSRGSDRRIPVR